MIKFEAIAAKLAAIVCTLVLSTTLVLGAVGPAQAGFAKNDIARTIA